MWQHHIGCFTACLLIPLALHSGFARAATQRVPTVHAALFDELDVLYPDSSVGDGSKQLDSDTPYGTFAGVQLLVTGLKSGTRLQIGLRPRGTTLRGVQLYRLHDVPVPANTGPRNGLEKPGGKQNEYVIRNAPFRVFEAHEPVSPVMAVPDGVSTMAFRIEFTAPRVTRTRSVPCRIEVRTGRSRLSLEWNVTVHPVAVPPASESPFTYTNWFEEWILPNWHRGARDLDAIRKTYWDLVLRSRQNMHLIGIPVSGKGASVRFNHASFDRTIKELRSIGIDRFELGHLTRGSWGSADCKVRFTGKDISAPGQADVVRRVLKELKVAVGRNRLVGKVIIHIRDEITDKSLEKAKLLARLVHEELPGVPIAETVNTDPRKLVGSIDQWIPLAPDFQRKREFFEKRKAAGDKIWMYVCQNPGGKWVNRFIDQERTRQVYIGWSLAYYRLEGFLHWGFNYPSNSSPLENTTAGNTYPPGDTHLVYPGPDRAWGSHRLEAMRIGMEDVDLLHRLMQTDRARAEQIITKVFRAYDDYSTSVTEYRAAKKELLLALSK